MLQDCLELARQNPEQIEEDLPTYLKQALNKICGNIACKNSIKAHKDLSLDAMNTLLRTMEKTPHFSQCNHGRPTYTVLKKRDLERLFERR